MWRNNQVHVIKSIVFLWATSSWIWGGVNQQAGSFDLCGDNTLNDLSILIAFLIHYSIATVIGGGSNTPNFMNIYTEYCKYIECSIISHTALNERRIKLSRLQKGFSWNFFWPWIKFQGSLGSQEYMIWARNHDNHTRLANIRQGRLRIHTHTNLINTTIIQYHHQSY